MTRRTTLPLLGLVSACLLFASTTRADDNNLTVAEGSKGMSLDGDRYYETVTIAGELLVKAYTKGSQTAGWLHLHANTITIASTGTIVASERGYQGDKSGGDGPGKGGTVLGLDLANAMPGGGGGHRGKGGDGIKDLGSCLPLTNGTTNTDSLGGTTYDSSADPLGVTGQGSSGGTSQAGFPNTEEVVAGGKGGAVVVLTAATIVIDGKILANGQSPQPIFGSSPGGGAGGSIIITTGSLTLGTDALLSATGGTGGRKPKAMDKPIGGSGGGGLIVIRAPVANHYPPDDARFDVSGGPPPEQDLCMDRTGGGNGELAQIDWTECVDADEDGHKSKACGGADCNDGDPEINPAAHEICNGIDDNCNDQIDEQIEGAPPLCPVGSGTECDPDSKACVLIQQDGGTGGSPHGGSPEIKLGGGICAAISPGSSTPGGGLAGLAAAVLGLLLCRRRFAA